jgi:microcin C transport system permease protein
MDDLTKKKIKRFKSIKRGYYSFVVLVALVLLSLISELFVNNRALLVKYEGKYYFPTYTHFHPGTDFGLDYNHETNYRELKTKFKEEGKGNWVLLPLVPYSEYETDLREGFYPPLAPSIKEKHFLGTDSSGRDILARLIYGFRIAIFFSLLLLFCNYVIGVTLGCLMGYLGGNFDLFFQRLIEIWSNVPFLYIVIIISSIMVPTFGVLIGIMVFFGWMNMTWYMRTSTYEEKAKEYVTAARSLGASHWRIIFRHIIPNTTSVIITFIPFSIAGGITALTSLDYLGFGLPAPSPSWGELLKQGTDNLSAYWISSSVIAAMIFILIMVTFIGEAIREAFDPKTRTRYE